MPIRLRPVTSRFVWVIAAIAIVAAAACSSKSHTSASKLVATDVAKEIGVGLQLGTRTHGENCIADFDGDGRLDLLLSRHEGVWPLLRGLLNGRFEPYYKGLDPARRDRHGCATADFNGDGRLDVYQSIGACRGTCKAPKELWIQQPDHTFVDEAAKWGVSDPEGRGRVPVVLNANGDKLPDLFTGQDTGVKYRSPDRLWINKGDHFELQSGPPSIEIGALCAAAADINGDGYDELAVCTPEQGFHLYRNNKGTFVDDPKSFGLDTHGLKTVKFVDLNGDKRPDLATVTRTHVLVYLNDHGRYGKPVYSVKVKDGVDVAFGDVNADGHPDMYVQDGRSYPDQIFLGNKKGNGFTPGPELASPPGGSGDTVSAIPDWKGTGRAAFVVNNGFQSAKGARQLFEFSGG